MVQAFRYLPALAWMALIFYLSHQPSVPIPMRFPHQDKVMHFGAYFLLAVFLAFAAPGNRKKRFALAFLLAAAYGISDEFHQSFVPGRDVSALDWLADATGAWVGAWLYLHIVRRT